MRLQGEMDLDMIRFSICRSMGVPQRSLLPRKKMNSVTEEKDSA